MITKCVDCGEDLPPAAVNCAVCGEAAGFPNVRASKLTEETDALQERVRAALVSAEARDCRSELEQFGIATEQSSAVITMKALPLSSLVLSDNTTLASYHQLVGIGARIPEDNQFDAVRVAMDSKVNPHDIHKEISYAALSLDGIGVSWYGDFYVTLSDDAVKKRSSVFEENPFTFCEKHAVNAAKPIPPGYRAAWQQRPDLAMAKLHYKIEKGMDSTAFPGVLLEQGTASELTDFIEVHIYGPIHPKAISKVTARPPTDRTDKLIWKKIAKRLLQMGVEISEV